MQLLALASKPPTLSWPNLHQIYIFLYQQILNVHVIVLNIHPYFGHNISFEIFTIKRLQQYYDNICVKIGLKCPSKVKNLKI